MPPTVRVGPLGDCPQGMASMPHYNPPDMDSPLPLPKGFRASGVAAGIKKSGQPDVALIASDTDCNAAAVFTTNAVQAAPVLRGKSQLAEHAAGLRAVVINAGCANACTGEEGLTNAHTTAEIAALELKVGSLHPADKVFVMSTGVIGVQLPMDKIRRGALAAAAALDPDGLAAAARAIMTTDTRPKAVSREVMTGSGLYRIAGIAKGAGMIHPNMATMLACVVTDADVSVPRLKIALRDASRKSFNRISVDGDTSTNDTLLVLANGKSGFKPSAAEFTAVLTDVCVELAKMIARDGEGATKFISVRVTGAKSEKTAEAVGRTIAKSPLVKTAFYGEDANWGRIIAAAGYSGEAVDPDRMSLWFGGVHVFENGRPTQYSEEAATAAMRNADVLVHLHLGLGDHEATVWTCDMSHDYVTINGKYRT